MNDETKDRFADEAASTRAADERQEGSDQIGPYRLIQKIGEGGMGEVWVAEQREPIRRTVAVKVIKVGMDTRQVVARFETERQALALMDHPAIAKVLDAGATESGRPYFVMEHVKGEPITDYCDRHRLPTADRLALFIRVCEGVQHAHQKGIIHRDLKPSNVLVTIRDGRPAPNRRAVTIWENSLGQDHPWVAIGLNNVANVCSDLQRYEEAEALFHRSLQIREKVLGAGHYQTVPALRGLAAAQVQQGKYEDAEPLLQLALETLASTSRRQHPEYAATLWWLAAIYRDRAEYERAEPLYRQAAAIMEASFGAAHPDAARGVCLLGLCEQALGKRAEARALLQRALSTTSAPTARAIRSRSLEGLAGDALARGAYEEAADEYRGALAAAEQTFGPGDLETAELAARLASVLQQIGRGDEAAALLARALQAQHAAAVRGLKSQSEKIRSVVVLLLANRPAEARPFAADVFATGYRHRPFVALCRSHGIAMPVDR